LAEVSAAIGDVMWTTSELISEAGRDARLRAAIVTATGAHDAGTDAALGRAVLARRGRGARSHAAKSLSAAVRLRYRST